MKALFTLTKLNEPHQAFEISIPRFHSVSKRKYKFCCEKDQSIGLLAIKISLWLDQLDRMSADLVVEEQFHLWQLFFDETLCVSEHPDWISYSGEHDVAYTQVLAAIFKGVCLFLQTNDRYILMNARFAYFYAAWQWFNLVKRMYEIPDQEPKENLLDELAASYRLVKSILLNEEFAFAQRWIANWANQNIESGPILREKYMLSMVLSTPSLFKKISPNKPLDAPGLFSQNEPKWSITHLHPAFSKYSGAITAIRSLVVNWLLPRYDFNNALHLAYLLKHRKKNVLAKKFWLKNGWLLSGIFLLLGIAIVPGTLIFQKLAIPLIPSLLIQSVFVICPLLTLILKNFDSKLVPYFALPRVVGGIFVGYLAVMLESGTIDLVNAVWAGGGWLVILLWAFVSLLGISYLYQDVKPLVRNPGIAIQRALTVFFSALLISVFIGLAVVSWMTAAYHIPSNVEIYAVDCFLGLFGLVNFKLFVIFVPLALLTGLLTQFLFEDQTLMTSVWSPEQE